MKLCMSNQIVQLTIHQDHNKTVNWLLGCFGVPAVILSTISDGNDLRFAIQ